MSHPNNDHELVDFLKQHRSATPPAAPALEERLFAAIATTSQPTTVTAFRRSPTRSTRSVAWLVPSAIAAGLIATVVGYRTLVPAKPSAAELATLEASLKAIGKGL